MKRNISTRTILSLLTLAGAVLALVAPSLTTVSAGPAASGNHIPAHRDLYATDILHPSDQRI
jgi:hypothetical protein